MSELIRVKDARGGYDLPHLEKEAAHERMQQEFFSSGVGGVTIKDMHSKGFLVDDEGHILLTQRPRDAADNPGLWDTSWGSHVSAGDTPTTAAMYKSNLETGVASSILPYELFINLLENHPDMTPHMAITRVLGNHRNFVSQRVLDDGRTWQEPCEMTAFVGYYNGQLNFPRGIVQTGVRIDELRERIEESPDEYTADLRFLVGEYGNLLVPFTSLHDYYPNPDPRANELVQTYALNGEPLGTASRRGLHNPLIQAFRQGRAPPSKHDHVRVMLQRTGGEFYLQERSERKTENAGLRDKPVAGHVSLGDEYDTAVLHECFDELQIPATVLDPEDFRAAMRRPELLRRQAMLVRIKTLDNYVSRGRTLSGQKPWDETCNTAVYFGVYDGPIRFKDGEATGAQVRSLPFLEQELGEHPERYTTDVKDMVQWIKGEGFGDLNFADRN